MKTNQRRLILSLLIALIVSLMVSCKEEEEKPSHLLFEETFEGPIPFLYANSMEVGTWDYALQYVKTPVYQGTFCARFEIREEQELVTGGTRAEVTIVKGTDGEIGKNTWYSFAVYIPSESYAKDPNHDIISQWYKDGVPARLMIKQDKFLFEVGNEKDQKEEIDMGPIVKGVWYTFVFHFIHSHESDGFVEVWINGEHKLSRSGGNMYNADLPKWKIGIYRAKLETGTSLVKARIVYFDNIKVGNETATLEEMMP